MEEKSKGPAPAVDETEQLKRQLAEQQAQINALMLERLREPVVDSKPIMKAEDRPRGHRLSNHIFNERQAFLLRGDREGLAEYDRKLEAEGYQGRSPAEITVTAHQGGRAQD